MEPGTGLFGDRIEQTTWGSEVTFNFSKRVGLSAGYVRYLTGEQVFNAPAFTYGVVYKY